MTINNYTNQQLLEEVEKLNISNICLNRMLNKYHHCLYEKILNRTNFLDSNAFTGNTIPIQARLYCLKNNIIQHPICNNPSCNNHVGWSKRELSFQHHCCNACSNKDPSTIQKYNQTCQLKWGVDNAFQAQEIKDKIKQSNLSILGVENPSQSDKIKQKKSNTTMEHFGVNCPFQSDEIKSKIRQTQINIYGGYGLQSKEIQDKVRNASIRRFGVEYASQSPAIKEKVKETCNSKYGVDNVSKLEDVKDKIKQSCISHWGVDNFSKSSLFQSYVKYRIFHNNMWFDSRWEVVVYDFCTVNNIQFKYKPDIILEYEYDNKTFSYHPDFIINKRICEVKGDQFFRINNNTQKEEMYQPFGRKKYGEEKWNWLCGKQEAKHQCMIKNNVLILRDKDIRNLQIELFIN